MPSKLKETFRLAQGVYEAREGKTYGLLAEFSDPGALYHAATEVRNAGYRHFDVHSPFPIHGMDRAMGLTNSKVGYITLAGGITGMLLGIWMQWWMGEVDYPLNIGGKPFFAIEPSIPIIFELTILLSAVGAVVGMLVLNGLPRPYNPLFYSEQFSRASDDAFFLHIAASDARFDREGTARMLQEIGALHVEVIEDHGTVNPESAPAEPA